MIQSKRGASKCDLYLAVVSGFLKSEYLTTCWGLTVEIRDRASQILRIKLKRLTNRKKLRLR